MWLLRVLCLVEYLRRVMMWNRTDLLRELQKHYMSHILARWPQNAALAMRWRHEIFDHIYYQLEPMRWLREKFFDTVGLREMLLVWTDHFWEDMRHRQELTSPHRSRRVEEEDDLTI